MPKAKREERKEKDEYEFVLPVFDETAFIRREVQNAKASFWTLGLGLGAGIVSVALYTMTDLPWWAGWLPILGAMGLLRPLLEKVGFGEEVTKSKALIGSYFMLFFTGLAVWILGINLV